jgi:hypothetical protein
MFHRQEARSTIGSDSTEIDAVPLPVLSGSVASRNAQGTRFGFFEIGRPLYIQPHPLADEASTSLT